MIQGWAAWVVSLFMAVGGIAGVTSIFMVRAQKRKLVADTGKTSAEADNVLADAQAKRQQTEVSLLEPMRIIMGEMKLEMMELYIKVDRLQNWADSLVSLLKRNNIPVPEMPPLDKRKRE